MKMNLNGFLKTVIIVVLAIAAVVLIYMFALPPKVKGPINYGLMQVIDKDKFAEVQTIQNTKVLGQEAKNVTYEQMLEANGNHIYWDYAEEFTGGKMVKYINAYADGITVTLGENDDGGVYDDAKMEIKFTVYNDGKYDVSVGMNNLMITKDQRNMLFEKLSSGAK